MGSRILGTNGHVCLFMSAVALDVVSIFIMPTLDNVINESQRLHL